LFAFEKKAGRIELFVRILYSIPIGLVLWIYGTIAGICLVFQWFIILIAGRRINGIAGIINGYLQYYTRVVGYLYLTTDRRPPILPKPVAIYEKKIFYDRDSAEIISREEG
jgi:cobalamin synthase